MTHILVIEDEEHIRRNMAETLEFNDYTVRTADCGTTGLNLALTQQPDLIICDIMMDDMDGYEVLNKVRENAATATTPFIFVTARADRRSMRTGMEMGADDYLTKPFTTHELINAVRIRLDRHNMLASASNSRLHHLRDRLNRMISQELQDPLESVNMIVDVISRQIGHLSREEVNDLLNTVSIGTRRMNRAISQMDIMMQLTSGQLTPETINKTGRSMRLWEIVVTAIDMAHHYGFQRRDVFINFGDFDKGTWVLCDPVSLKQALAELILNALLHSPQDTQVDVTQWDDDDCLWIQVEDRGPGMSTAQLQAALNSLYDRNTASDDCEQAEKMGIGLSLAKGIIEAHNGTLDIRTALNRGTRVTVRLPADQRSGNTE